MCSPGFGGGLFCQRIDSDSEGVSQHNTIGQKDVCDACELTRDIIVNLNIEQIQFAVMFLLRAQGMLM